MWRDPALHPLSHQHQHGLALSVLIERGLRDDPSPGKARELQQKVAGAWRVELRGHFEVEEKTLFPPVRPRLDDEALIDELIEQHRRLEDLARRVAAAEGESLRDVLVEFGATLSRHIRLEERQLFEQIQAKLSAEEIAELGRAIEANVAKVCPLTAGLPWEDDAAS